MAEHCGWPVAAVVRVARPFAHRVLSGKCVHKEVVASMYHVVSTGSAVHEVCLSALRLPCNEIMRYLMRIRDHMQRALCPRCERLHREQMSLRPAHCNTAQLRHDPVWPDPASPAIINPIGRVSTAFVAASSPLTSNYKHASSTTAVRHLPSAYWQAPAKHAGAHPPPRDIMLWQPTITTLCT